MDNQYYAFLENNLLDILVLEDNRTQGNSTMLANKLNP